MARIEQCEICGSCEYIGTESRPKKNCANCYAMERHRYLAKKLKEHSQDEIRNVLEIAPFSRRIFGDFLRDLGTVRYVGTDKWEHGNPVDPRNVTFADVYTDIVGMEKVIDGPFDVIIMQQVLEEVPMYEDALRSISHLMRNGAVAYLGIRIANNDKHIKIKQNNFGDVWNFGFNEMVSDLNYIFDKAVPEKIVSEGWNGDMFICFKK